MLFEPTAQVDGLAFSSSYLQLLVTQHGGKEGIACAIE
jgi:hypothetical protein